MIPTPLLSLGALVFAAVATAKPIPAFKDVLSKRGGSHSFDNYGGFSSMKNFDNFYGSDDFSGVSQTLVKTKDVVCHSQSIEIVQQQLAVIREYYKKIITQQICEVEVQTVVHQQFVSGCEGFSSDIRRASSHDRDVSYDHSIASQISVIHDDSGECVTNDLGWQGTDCGSNAVSYSGDNWNSETSPSSVSSIYNSCQQSYGYSSPSYSSSWSSSSSSPSYGSYGYGSSYSSYVAPSYDYTYIAPPPTYTYVAPPSYSYVAPPSYSYVAPPTYSYDSSYGYGDSYVSPPPTYTAPSYGSYGSSSYVPPSYGSGYSSPDVSAPDVSSNVTDCTSCDSSCDGCDSSSDISTDISAAPLPTDTSLPVPTDSADASAPTDTTDATDATDAPVAATDSIAAAAPTAAVASSNATDTSD